ncbi:hypothetical protein R70006_04999 [Paraburkholderia domus]|uniref:hypothetical protein n=1 Tax=Paraburkholderia domus TaxID=2793075 RepID=UPI001912A40B|nr:hypothetical protein [Paraburkholderia domus]MBK5051765.1 hypothetical protein [Burkholderia sp. R-70006]CAE6794342.1 hypothetical protein R70006_04999 [Paraburkholderia domus]
MDSTTSTEQGLLNLLITVGNAYPAIQLLLSTFFVLVGVYLVGSAIKGIYDLTAHGTFAHGGYHHKTHGGLLWRLFIGVVLTALTYSVGLLGNSIFGTEVSSGLMAYQTAGASAAQQAAVTAVFEVFALCGFAATGHGWLTLNASKSGQNQVGAKASVVWILSGIGLIYLPQVLNAIAALTGLNVVNLLLF